MNETTMDLIRCLLAGFITGCLFTVIAVEIGRALKKRKSVFEIECKIRPMPPIEWTKEDIKKGCEKVQESWERQFIAEGERYKPKKCKHDEYLKELTRELDKMCLTFIDRHWLYTTAFTYLHNDKDHCDCNNEPKFIKNHDLKFEDIPTPPPFPEPIIAMFNRIMEETNQVPTIEQVDAALKIIARDL